MSSAVQKIEVTNGALTPMDMLNHAVERGAGLDVVSKLMDLQERWEQEPSPQSFRCRSIRRQGRDTRHLQKQVRELRQRQDGLSA
jgi:hypothetical protein